MSQQQIYYESDGSSWIISNNISIRINLEKKIVKNSKMKLLELFSGTHSIGKVAEKYNIDVVSLDRDLPASCPFTDYTSKNHINADIMTWDYKKFNPNEFDIITASPVCLWWSCLRKSWIGRKLKAFGDIKVTREMLEGDIDLFGKPMVDKVFEIINYFNPKYFWIENPQTGSMKHYIDEKYQTPYLDVDYCKYSSWGYKKRTRFWYKGLDNFKPKTCKWDCENYISVEDKETKKVRKCHKANCSKGKITTKDRYRIPETLIEDFFKEIVN
tara:strand:- start:2544 stop:3356 length:813 start_codon:yes stop_codon:yes gene_type:complete